MDYIVIVTPAIYNDGFFGGVAVYSAAWGHPLYGGKAKILVMIQILVQNFVLHFFRQGIPVLL